MKARIALLLVSSVVAAAAAEVVSGPAGQARIEVVAPEFGEPGVVVKAAQLRVSSGSAPATGVTLDVGIHRVEQVIEHGDTAIVIGQAKYGWIVQRIDLQTLRVSEGTRCAQPRPVPSSDGSRVVYVRGISRRDYVRASSVVMVMDVATTQTAAVFPEENAASADPYVEEVDEMWHNWVVGNFLWLPDGSGLVLVAKRMAEQWWHYDLCLVDLSSGIEKPRIARRRLDFSGLLKEGHEPSDSCKYDIQAIAWAVPGAVRVTIDRCLFMTSGTATFPVPAVDTSIDLSRSAGLGPMLGLEKGVPGGFTAVKPTPWMWVTRIAADGAVHGVLDERLSYFSEVEGVDVDVRVVQLESVAAAAQAASTLMASNKAIKWQRLSSDSGPPCGLGACWASTAHGLFRLLVHAGRVCVLVTAYSRDVFPGEESGVDARTVERHAKAFAELAVKKAELLAPEAVTK